MTVLQSPTNYNVDQMEEDQAQRRQNQQERMSAGEARPYVLEVVKFNDLEHVGYMKVKFRTPDDACAYYDRHNPHMRSLNAHGTYRSDWDPETRLLYIVREDYLILPTVLPFSTDDASTYGWA